LNNQSINEFKELQGTNGVRFYGENHMGINRKYRIEEKHQKLTLDLIRQIGFDEALDIAYGKALYATANSPQSTMATELLAWSHNLFEDAKTVSTPNVAEELKILSRFYRKLAHKLYWELKRTGQLSDISDFIRLVE
jgi:hypothetical protein